MKEVLYSHSTPPAPRHGPVTPSSDSYAAATARMLVSSPEKQHSHRLCTRHDLN